MKRFFSGILGKCALALYWFAFASLAGAHVYATVLAYQYVHAWKASRALVWVFLTFLIPVLSTIYWFVVHWTQTGVFWNWLTSAIIVGIGCIAAGMLCEVVKKLASSADRS